MQPTNIAGSAALRSVAYLVAALFSCCMLSGCLVAGVSSSGHAFIWPGGFGLILVLLLLFLLLRRR